MTKAYFPCTSTPHAVLVPTATDPATLAIPVEEIIFLIFPTTSNFALGVLVPIPTFALTKLTSSVD